MAAFDGTTGIVDPNFNPDVGRSAGGFFPPSVGALALGADKIYAGGDFDLVNQGRATEATRNYLAAFDLAGGDVIAGFDPNPNSAIFALELGGGKLYAGGPLTLTSVNEDQATEAARNRIAAFDPDTGIVDPDFDPNLDSSVSALKLDGGKLYVAGGFQNVNQGQPTAARRPYLAAFDPGSGEVDGDFAPEMDDSPLALAFAGDGLHAAGQFNRVGDAYRPGLATFASVPELSGAPASLGFGSRDVDDGATAVQESTVTNTGTADVVLTSVSLGGADPGEFERLTGAAGDCTDSTTLAAGATCKLRMRFDPGATGAKSATVTVASNAPDVTVALSGTGTQTAMSRTPVSLSFGSHDIDDGATAAQESTVTNTGTEPVTLTAVSIGGADPGEFERLTGDASDCTDSTSLAAGATCKVRMRFDPATTGAMAATVTVASNAPDVTVALTGTGTQTQLSRTPGSLGFGSRDVADGPTAAQESTVTNTGTEPVTLTAVSVGGADPGEFARLTGDASDCTDSTTLAAGETCKVRTRFDPTTTGAKSATVTVASNAPDVTVALTGTGTQADVPATQGPGTPAPDLPIAPPSLPLAPDLPAAPDLPGASIMRVSISHPDTTVRRNRTAVGLTCLGTVSARCTGSVTLTATGLESRLAASGQRSTRTSFALVAGKPRTIRLALPRTTRARLARKNKAVVRVQVRLSDGTVASRLITLVNRPV